MENKFLTSEIKNLKDLERGYTVRDGFVFTSITKANIFDAIVLRYPESAISWTPRLPRSNRSYEEHIKLIKKYEIKKALVISSSLLFLKEIPSIEFLAVRPSTTAPEGFDYSHLTTLSNLKWLSCSTEYGENFCHSTTIDYSELVMVQYLEINGKGHINSNSLPNLVDLRISEQKKKTKILSDYFTSEKLRHLEIVQCNIDTLNGIDKAKNLKELNLYYLRNLKEIDAIKHVAESLEKLSIVNCNHISDLNIIGTLSNLKYLRISGNNEIPDLDFLLKLPNLKHFSFSINVLDGNLTQCSNIPYVYSEINRKHYNLKDNELPKNNFYKFRV